MFQTRVNDGKCTTGMDLLIGFLPHGELQGDPPGKSSCPLDGDHPAVPGCLLFGLSGSSPDGIATSVCAKKNKELAMWGVLKNYSFTVFDIRCEKQEHGTWNIQNLAWLWRPQCCCGVMIFTYNEVIRRVSKIPMVFPSSTYHPCRSPCGPTLEPDQLSQRWKAGSQLLWGWLTTYFHIFLSMSIYLYLCLSLVRVEVVHDFHDWICMDLPWVGS